ncbi:MAG: hypothetical protein LBD32_02840, partial [Cytophagales bacterium]|nr:hypothetical protein [Cytophagales bacterium]
MKRSFTFFVLMLVVCGLFYFQKTKTQKENQVLVQSVVRLKDECDEKLRNILNQKKDFNNKLDNLKTSIDKNNEIISQNDSKIKNLLKNPKNKSSVETLKKKNEELKEEMSEKNSESELLNNKIDSFANVEFSLNDWKQKAFEILKKTQTGNLSKEDKVKLNAVTEDFKNLEKIFL